MSNLKILRGRVKSIKSTQKITKAMQMVAASKLKKIRDQISDSHNYLDVLSRMMSVISSGYALQDLAQNLQKFFDPLAASLRPVLFIVLTAERGLCGSFNFSIIKKVKTDLSLMLANGKKIKLIVIGKKGYDALKNDYLEYIDGYFNISKSMNENTVHSIKQKIVQMVENEEVGECNLYFSKFKNAITQVSTKQTILPVILRATGSSNCDFEGEGLVQNLVNLYIEGQINYALLQNKASEEGARMTAMDSATKNANEMIDKLTLSLNRSRQAIITKELIEIISGAEAG